MEVNAIPKLKFDTPKRMAFEVEKKLIEGLSVVDEMNLNALCKNIYDNELKNYVFTSDESIKFMNDLFHFNEFHEWLIGDLLSRINKMIMDKHENYKQYNSMESWFNEHEDKLDFNWAMARRYMLARDEYDPETLQKIGITKASKISLLPDGPEKEQLTKFTIENNPSVREISKQIKEIMVRDELNNEEKVSARRKDKKIIEKKINKEIIISNFTRATDRRLKDNQVMFQLESKELLELFIQEVLSRYPEIKKSIHKSFF